MSPKKLALIVGVGDGLSSSLARLFSAEGYKIALAARNTKKLSGLAAETNAATFTCDATKRQDVDRLFSSIAENTNSARLDVVIYNPSLSVKAPIQTVDPNEVRKAIDVNILGSFLVGQQAARAMLQQQKGTILFTGASAGYKGMAHSAAFAMGKFAQRGLAESMARELHPQNVHVCYVNIDGHIAASGTTETTSKHKDDDDDDDAMLDPDAIAQTYLALVKQHRSAWTSELTVRPWIETW